MSLIQLKDVSTCFIFCIGSSSSNELLFLKPISNYYTQLSKPNKLVNKANKLKINVDVSGINIHSNRNVIKRSEQNNFTMTTRTRL